MFNVSQDCFLLGLAPGYSSGTTRKEVACCTQPMDPNSACSPEIISKWGWDKGSKMTAVHGLVEIEVVKFLVSIDR